MNPVFGIIDKLVSTVDGLVNSMSPKLASTIRSAYLFLIFVLAIAALFIGINMGRSSAKISGAPIVDSTNDAFKYDVKKAKTEGAFQELVDRDLISEPSMFDHAKKEYRAKEPLEPDSGAGIVEPERHTRRKDSPGMDPDDRLAEGRYKPIGAEKTEVKPIVRKPDSEKYSGGAEGGENKDIRDTGMPADDSGAVRPTKESVEKKVNNADKKKSRIIKSGGRSGSPKPIDREQGAVEK